MVTSDSTAQGQHQLALAHLKKRKYTAKMTPWDRRAESPIQREKRREKQLEDELRDMEEKKKERENGIEQFLISGECLSVGDYDMEYEYQTVI